MNKIIIITFVFIACLAQQITAQQTKKMTLDEVIKLALDQSPESFLAKHKFRGSYWQLRTHKAKFKPSLTLNAELPDLNRSISQLTLSDGTDAFVERKVMNSSVDLQINQNIGFTGGQIFVTSGLQRIDLLQDSTTTSYLSTPINIGFIQPLFAFNSYRWERKIEPLLYDEAKQQYIETLETISMNATYYFFDLITAQINLSIANMNYSNSDTLYKISKGRYNVGTIAQNDLLQMELNYLNSSIALEDAKLDLEIKKFKLRSFLGFNNNVDIELVIPQEVPEFKVDVNDAIAKAKESNSQIIGYQRQLIESNRDVAEARAKNRFNANFYATYGLTQSTDNLDKVYTNPQDQQMVRVGITVPIIDWGLGRGRYKMAQSNQEATRVTVEQALVDFEQDVFLKVMQFNMQASQVKIKAKADTVAQNRYEVSKQRFLIGKIDVLNLNDALTEKDIAKRNYISALRSYWYYYFIIRKISLFDYQKSIPLKQEFEKLID